MNRQKCRKCGARVGNGDNYKISRLCSRCFESLSGWG